MLGASPNFLLLQNSSSMYFGTYFNNNSLVHYFVISANGDILILNEISLRDLGDIDYIDSQDALKADKTYVDNKVKTDVPERVQNLLDTVLPILLTLQA